MVQPRQREGTFHTAILTKHKLGRLALICEIILSLQTQGRSSNHGWMRILKKKTVVKTSTYYLKQACKYYTDQADSTLDVGHRKVSSPVSQSNMLWDRWSCSYRVLLLYSSPEKGMWPVSHCIHVPSPYNFYDEAQSRDCEKQSRMVMRVNRT